MGDSAIIEEHILNELAPQAHGHMSPRQLYADLAVPSESRSIRLLDLQPALMGQDESPLIGCLHVAYLRDRPAFTTLSYVWGPKEFPSPTITCLPYQVDLEITTSSSKALQHIRRLFGAVTIWVDSICINQNDDDDKASQIATTEVHFRWKMNRFNLF